MKYTIHLIFVLLLSLCAPAAWAQATLFPVEGTVTDENGELLIGVTVVIKDQPGVGTATDVEGHFHLPHVPEHATLVFSYIGFETKEVFIGSAPTQPLKITLEESHEALDEVVVVGHGEQRKVSVVGAVATIDPADLQVPATSITNMMGGRIPGIISVTRSGEPGNDFSEFWVRGISTFGANSSALVLIDGVEGDLNDLDPADIESFSVLKDASATAVYGVRGANGVVVVTTKRGKAGKLNVNIKSNVTLSYSPRMPEYLEAYDYARLANEARAVRPRPLSQRGLAGRHPEKGGLEQPALPEHLRRRYDCPLLPQRGHAKQVCRIQD